MKVRWTALFTSFLLTVVAIPSLVGAAEERTDTLSTNGPGLIEARGEDLVVTLEDDALLSEITVLGGAWLNPVKTQGHITIDYSQDLTVHVDTVPVVTIGKDNAAIRGIRVVRYSKSKLLREAVGSVPAPLDSNPDFATCGAGGVVTGDDECYAGGPGALSATYRCGWWVFAIDVGVNCSAGYYACITGCGSADCRNMQCAPPPAIRK